MMLNTVASMQAIVARAGNSNRVKLGAAYLYQIFREVFAERA
jgi:hypothetical protein